MTVIISHLDCSVHFYFHEMRGSTAVYGFPLSSTGCCGFLVSALPWLLSGGWPGEGESSGM